MTERTPLLPGVQDFRDNCEKYWEAHARDHGNSDIFPEGAEEFAYALVEAGGVQASGAATDARRAIQQHALDARNDSEEWTNGFPSLGASADEVIQAQWRRVAGIMRVCMVHVHSRDPEPVKHCEKVGAGGTAPGDSSEEQPKDTLDGTLLNSYIKSSLSKHLRFIGDVKEGNDDDNKRNWGKVKAVFSDPASRKARGRNCPGNANIEFEIVSGSHLLGYGYDGNAINNDKVFDIVEEKCGAKQRNYFWVVIDVLNASPDATNDLLTYVYRKLCGDGKGRQAPESMKPNGLMKAGVYGLEGVVIARDWPSDGVITNPVLALKKNDGPRDMCWGGDVWLAWMMSLYQRAAAEQLANEVSDVGAALTLSKGTVETKRKTSSLKQNDDQSTKDKLTVLKRYWENVIALETKWMYREVSRNSDVDSAYQHFQKCYDIEAMWNDVREQTELIARYAEMEHDRTVSKTQTYGGIFFGSAIFLAGFFGMNVFGEKGLSLTSGVDPKRLAADTMLFVGTIAILAVVWFWKSTSSMQTAAWLRCHQPHLVGLLSIALALLTLIWLTPTVFFLVIWGLS